MCQASSVARAFAPDRRGVLARDLLDRLPSCCATGAIVPARGASPYSCGGADLLMVVVAPTF